MCPPYYRGINPCPTVSGGSTSRRNKCQPTCTCSEQTYCTPAHGPHTPCTHTTDAAQHTTHTSSHVASGTESTATTKHYLQPVLPLRMDFYCPGLGAMWAGYDSWSGPSIWLVTPLKGCILPSSCSRPGSAEVSLSMVSETSTNESSLRVGGVISPQTISHSPLENTFNHWFYYHKITSSFPDSVTSLVLKGIWKLSCWPSCNRPITDETQFCTEVSQGRSNTLSDPPFQYLKHQQKDF